MWQHWALYADLLDFVFRLPSSPFISVNLSSYPFIFLRFLYLFSYLLLYSFTSVHLSASLHPFASILISAYFLSVSCSLGDLVDPSSLMLFASLFFWLLDNVSFGSLTSQISQSKSKPGFFPGQHHDLRAAHWSLPWISSVAKALQMDFRGKARWSVLPCSTGWRWGQKGKTSKKLQTLFALGL